MHLNELVSVRGQLENTLKLNISQDNHYLPYLPNKLDFEYNRRKKELSCG